MIKIICEQGSEAWHQNRLGRITGTRFKELMSGESTKGYKDLILDLTSEIITGTMEESYSNDNMERGKELEPIARKEYESIFDVEVEQVGFVIPDENNPFYDFIGISPDGIINNGLLEIKCPLRKTHLRYINENRLPIEYKHQVQGQLFVTGLDYCDFVSYYPGMKLFAIRVYPDKELHLQYEAKINDMILLVKNMLSDYNNYNLLEK